MSATQRRSASTRRRVSASSAAATSSSSPARTCSASAPWPASGSSSPGSKRSPISASSPSRSSPQAASTTASRPALAALAQPRVDVPAQRLDRERRLEREQLRAPAHRRGADPHARTGARRRRTARRADPRAAGRRRRRALRCRSTSCPSPSGRRRRCGRSSSASSSSLTKTPRAPISPNGFVRSRSPAVVIGTSAISIPGRRSRSARQLGLGEREPTAARTDAESTARRRDGPRLAAAATRSGCCGRMRTNAVGACSGSGRYEHEPARHRRRSSSPSPNRCRTTSA